MSLRVIIDSNRLQSNELQRFLSTNPTNLAVLTDYAWMEAYKGNSVLSIQRSMSVLKDFPDQVIVLKGTKTVSALDPRAPGLAQRMCWPGEEKNFRDTVVGLRQATEGHPGAIRQILEHGKAADQQMHKMLADVVEIPLAFQDIARRDFTEADVKEIKANKEYSIGLKEKLFCVSGCLAQRLYKSHPAKPRQPSRRSRYDAFMYRLSLAALLYFLTWVRDGGPLQKGTNKLRNDMVDIIFATFGTYFHGVMSQDKRVQALETELRGVLSAVGARVPEYYLPIFMQQVGDTPA